MELSPRGNTNFRKTLAITVAGHNNGHPCTVSIESYRWPEQIPKRWSSFLETEPPIVVSAGFLSSERERKAKALRIGATHVQDGLVLETHSAPGHIWCHSRTWSPAWRPLPLHSPHHSFHFDIMKVQLAHCLSIAYENWKHVSELASLQRALEL